MANSLQTVTFQAETLPVFGVCPVLISKWKSGDEQGKERNTQQWTGAEEYTVDKSEKRRARSSVHTIPHTYSGNYTKLLMSVICLQSFPQCFIGLAGSSRRQAKRRLFIYFKYFYFFYVPETWHQRRYCDILWSIREHIRGERSGIYFHHLNLQTHSPTTCQHANNFHTCAHGGRVKKRAPPASRPSRGSKMRQSQC